MSLKEQDPAAYEHYKRQFLALMYGMGWRRYLELSKKWEFERLRRRRGELIGEVNAKWKVKEAKATQVVDKVMMPAEEVGVRVTVTDEGFFLSGKNAAKVGAFLDEWMGGPA